MANMGFEAPMVASDHSLMVADDHGNLGPPNFCEKLIFEYFLFFVHFTYKTF